MATRIVQETEAQRPAVTPLNSSVLDHATVVEKTGDFGRRNNQGLFPSYNVLDMFIPTRECPAPSEDKVFAVVPWVPAFTFEVYGGVKCNAVGLDVDDQKAEALRVFKASEGKGVEAALLENRFVARALDLTLPVQKQVEWDAPVDITPGTNVPLPVAFALLEGYAASVYHGQPTIHMSRAAASLLGADKVEWQGGKAFSRLGSKIAIGGGYEDTAGSDGQWDLYATGEVYVERSEVVNEATYVLPGVDPSGIGLHHNDHVTLIERGYRVGVDGFVARATGTVWS